MKKKTEDQIRDIRKKQKILPSYKVVDTCAKVKLKHLIVILPMIPIMR